MTKNTTPQMARLSHLVQQVVIVDGQGGCGKTMLAPIISALDRVELLTYAYEIEHVCSLYFLGKIELDVATNLIRMWTDLQLYNTLMSREINFRPSDISSVFRDAQPWRYLKRFLQKGDEEVPLRIAKQKPILNLTTHYLLGISEPIFSALDKRVVFLQAVRHPLYMLKQQTLNMEYDMKSARVFTMCFKHNKEMLPFWTLGWEDIFLRSNSVEKAIYLIEKMTILTERVRKQMVEKYNAMIITVPFECFVINPWPYMNKIEVALETKITSVTRRMMRRQNVPRKMYAEGIALPIYKRCGWEPPRQGADEIKEFEKRWQFAVSKASKEALEVLGELCVGYEEKYLGGRKKKKDGYV